MVPLSATIATLTMKEYGYTISRFPPINCLPANSDLFFYPVVLVNNLFLLAGIPILIIIVWSLHKVWSV